MIMSSNPIMGCPAGRALYGDTTRAWAHLLLITSGLTKRGLRGAKSNLFWGLNGSGVHETVAEQAHSGRRWLFYGEAGVLCYDDVSDIALLVSHAS